MEAIASGALILVDRMYVPRPYPLIEGVHIVYYGTYRIVPPDMPLSMTSTVLACCLPFSA
jgi:hypothetical protein